MTAGRNNQNTNVKGAIMIYNITGINVIFANRYQGSYNEAREYFTQAIELHPELVPWLLSITVKFSGDNADLEYTLKLPPVERVARWTEVRSDAIA